jgi:hypothetical protein
MGNRCVVTQPQGKALPAARQVQRHACAAPARLRDTRRAGEINWRRPV